MLACRVPDFCPPHSQSECKPIFILRLLKSCNLGSPVNPVNRPVAWFPASARWHVFRSPVSSFRFPVSAPPSAVPASPRESSFHSPVSNFQFLLPPPPRSPRAERELKFLTQRHKATKKKKTKQGRRSGPFSDPQMTQIAQIFKHQIQILSICENLCNLWMIPISSLPTFPFSPP